MNKHLFIFSFVGIFTLFQSCKSLQTAPFDQYAYQKTIELKVQSEQLIDKSTTPYQSNLVEIGQLLNNLKLITEYEKNRPNNEVTSAMWMLLSDKDKNLLVGFFKYWQEKESLSSVFSQEAKMQIQEAFNLLIKYETVKDKVSEQNILQYIQNQ